MELQRLGMGSLVLVVGVECIKISNDARDFDLSTFESSTAQLDEIGGSTNLLSQTVDVDIVSLEFGEDGLEFGDGIGVTERIGGVLLCCHGVSQSIAVAVLVTEPSENVVTRVSPRTTSALLRMTVPLEVRVIDQPRASVRMGSTALSRAANSSSI